MPTSDLLSRRGEHVLHVLSYGLIFVVDAERQAADVLVSGDPVVIDYQQFELDVLPGGQIDVVLGRLRRLGG